MPDQTFPKTYRVRRENEYKAVFEAGIKLKAWPILAFVRPNGLPYSRMGMAVSRKVGPAHRRNRIKRLFREAFRLLRAELPPGWDVVLVPIDRQREYTLPDVQKSLRRIFRQAAQTPP